MSGHLSQSAREKVEKFKHPMEAYEITHDRDTLRKAIESSLEFEQPNVVRNRAMPFLGRHCNLPRDPVKEMVDSLSTIYEASNV